VTGLKYTDVTVTAGTTYKYVVTAVDSLGLESAFSLPIAATVP
jgi:fibronectin type 3 domain-containing protein